jgi:hypothetical protein
MEVSTGALSEPPFSNSFRLDRILFQASCFALFARGVLVVQQSTGISFLITEAGEHIAIDQAPRAEGTSASGTDDPVNLAVTQNGFVLMSLTRNAAMVELCPPKVQPLAALETLHVLKEMRAECVLMSLSGDSWRASKYEFFTSTEAAIDKLSSLTRSARKRRAERVAGLKPAFSRTQRQPTKKASGLGANPRGET